MEQLDSCVSTAGQQASCIESTLKQYYKYKYHYTNNDNKQCCFNSGFVFDIWKIAAKILDPKTQSVYFKIYMLTMLFFQMLKRTKEEQEKWR